MAYIVTSGDVSGVEPAVGPAGAGGRVTLTYTSSSPAPAGGSDGLGAAPTARGTPVWDTYTYH